MLFIWQSGMHLKMEYADPELAMSRFIVGGGNRLSNHL